MGFSDTLESESLRRSRCHRLLLDFVAQQAGKRTQATDRENNRHEAMALTAWLWGVDPDLTSLSRRVSFEDLFVFLLVPRCQKMRFSVISTRRLTAHCTNEFRHHSKPR